MQKGKNIGIILKLPEWNFLLENWATHNTSRVMLKQDLSWSQKGAFESNILQFRQILKIGLVD